MAPQSSVNSGDCDGVPPTNVAKAEERTNDASSATPNRAAAVSSNEKRQQAATTNDDNQLWERWHATYHHVYSRMSVDLRPTFVSLMNPVVRMSQDEFDAMAPEMDRIRREIEAQEESAYQEDERKLPRRKRERNEWSSKETSTWVI